MFAWVHIGLGIHEDLIMAQNPTYLIRGAKYFYVATLFFDTSICLPKLSALFFYARVFNAKNRALRIQLWVLGGLVGAWLLSAYLVTIFQCKPIARAWNTTIPGKCIDTFPWFTATAVISCAIDIWILVIPIPLIWGLNSSLRRRIYLLIAFFLTYSVIVLSVGRMAVTIQLIPTIGEDETWRLPIYIYWSVIEGSLSIVSISVPNAIALVKHFQGHPKNSSAGTGKSSNYASHYELNRSENYASINGGRESLGESSDNQELVEAIEQNPEMAPGNIHVRTKIRVY